MTHPLLTIRLALKRLYDHEMAPIMAAFDLTRMELDVLLFLKNNPGCDTAAEIVQLQMMTKSHVSKAVDRLTERGLITQARDEKNRRKIHLSVTEAAAPVLTQALEAQNRIVALMIKDISREDNETVCRVIRQVNHNVSIALDD